jgi:Organic solute transporter Ostalpha
MGEESPLLLSPVAKARNAAKDAQNSKRGIVINRIGLVTEGQISALTLQLESASENIAALQTLTGAHERVIARFNSSVTNADVIDRLGRLEGNVSQTAADVYAALDRTERGIDRELHATVEELNASVQTAQREIGEQVDKVKRDVDSYVMTTQDQFSMENSFMVYQLAGTFTLLSCLISMWHMTAHLRKLNQPAPQRKILAILWMCPIYAITSWFSLVFHSAEGYLAIVKDAYEAYVIYQFLSFCIAVLGRGDRATVVDLLAKHASHLTPPFRLFGCCCPDHYENDRALADAILLQSQVFAMQFVFFRPLTTTAMVVLKQLQYYGAGDGPTDYRAPQFYITIVQNVSIFVAFTGLLKFYHAVDKELAWCRPFAKFLCIKGVVFMTFWQGLAISVLAQTTDLGGADADEWAQSAQNFLICLEMLLFSIAHFYCFPTEEWEDGYQAKHSGGRFGDSLALGDFLSDLKLILKSKNSTGNGKRKIAKEKILQEILEEIPEADYEQEEENANDDDNITEEMMSAAVSEDDEKFICDALQDSLGSVGDDPDIAEATRRLLESKILSPEFFDYSETDTFDTNNDDPALAEARRLVLGSAASSSEDMEGLSGSVRRHSPDPLLMSGGSAPAVGAAVGAAAAAAQRSPFTDLEGGPTESTSLLGGIFGTSSEPSPLRPSIFTVVASLAENDRKKEDDKDGEKELRFK